MVIKSLFSLAKYVLCGLAVIYMIIILLSFEYTKVCHNDIQYEKGKKRREISVDSTHAGFNAQFIKKAIKT